MNVVKKDYKEYKQRYNLIFKDRKKISNEMDFLHFVNTPGS